MRRHAGLLALCAPIACGDNHLADGVPLAPAAELVVVAHQDDDLLFMQPDIVEAVQRGDGVTSVYVTAGNGAGGLDKVERRTEGLLQAYAAAAGADDWRCGFITITGHAVQHCRLAARGVSLVFLGYPDGGKEGERATSLLALWEGRASRVTTIAEQPAAYDRRELIEAVAQIVRETNPARMRTLEVAATHGRDHSDHMLVGALAVLALARAGSDAELWSYRGYATADEPPNKLPAVFDAMFAILARYEACAAGCAACGDACTAIDQTHVTWLLRRYAVGFRQAAAGRLRAGTECLRQDAALGACTDAPTWRIDRGQLRSGDTCIVVDDAGAVAAGACLGGPERRFFLDDEGHLWSGLPPAHEPDLAYAHLRCLAPEGAAVRARPCGANRAPIWEVAPPTVESARADLGFFATGRDVRLGDLTGDGKADLCAVRSSGLLCAPGDGRGGFSPAVRIDNAAQPLAIEARSLALGDVDGDGRLDACGRDAAGILCATAATAFVVARFSESFADPVARAGTAASLAAIDANADGVAEICGVDVTGVVCAPRGLAFQPMLRSPWPDPAAVVWPADLDGDRQADWCAATEHGPACAVEAQRALTTDGAPWGWAQGGAVDVAPANSATVAFGDIDGDGRADSCVPREDRIECARSQGRAFGPRATTIAILPNQSVASALWLGDLDGDGRADPCVDTGPSIVCAVAP